MTDDIYSEPPEAPVVVIGAGQSGPAATRALHKRGVPAIVLETSDRPARSRPLYYDNLRLFSPAAYGSMPEAHGLAERSGYLCNPDRVIALDLGICGRLLSAFACRSPAGGGLALSDVIADPDMDHPARRQGSFDGLRRRCADRGRVSSDASGRLLRGGRDP